jgi:hypothetical protein
MYKRQVEASMRAKELAASSMAATNLGAEASKK